MRSKLIELEGTLEELASILKLRDDAIKKMHEDQRLPIITPVYNGNSEEQELFHDYKYVLVELNKKIEEKEKIIKIQHDQIENHLMSEKSLRNQIIDLMGKIRVFCRVKPACKHNSILIDKDKIIIENKIFSFDKVFDQLADQQHIYKELELCIKSVTDGYSLCIFAYGQTGSGKTYTMEGDKYKHGLIFNSLKGLQDQIEISKNLGFNSKYLVKYIEIYNENIIDLFSDNIVQLIHDSNEIYLKGCSEKTFFSLEDLEVQIQYANTKRKTGETMCNQKSSRSHAILIINVFMDSETEKREGKLVLIDLAGSERLNESMSENHRLKETQSINKSLSALGNVINAIKRGEKHIPFRDSKLTHLMQEYLSGNSRIAMIINLNPESINETISSLRFASKVSECTLGLATKNVRKLL